MPKRAKLKPGASLISPMQPAGDVGRSLTHYATILAQLILSFILSLGNTSFHKSECSSA